MARKRSMAVDTRIVAFAASHLDGDDVGRGVVVHASGIWIEVDSAYGNLRAEGNHRRSSIVAESLSVARGIPGKWVSIFSAKQPRGIASPRIGEPAEENRANTMKKFAYIALIAMLGTFAFAEKVTAPGTIRDLQPTNYAVARKKHQQFDFSIATASHSYGCRTPENKKLDATQFVVGSSVTFTANGRNGEVRTGNGKTAKCLITRVADNPLPPAPAR
jgi:hypothetical protein